MSSASGRLRPSDPLTITSCICWRKHAHTLVTWAHSYGLSAMDDQHFIPRMLYKTFRPIARKERGAWGTQRSARQFI